MVRFAYTPPLQTPLSGISRGMLLFLGSREGMRTQALPVPHKDSEVVFQRSSIQVQQIQLIKKKIVKKT